MTEDTTLLCRLCRQPLEEVHGRLCCLDPTCPLHGEEQGSCCAGAPLSSTGPGCAPDAPAPVISVRWQPDQPD